MKGKKDDSFWRDVPSGCVVVMWDEYPEDPQKDNGRR